MPDFKLSPQAMRRLRNIWQVWCFPVRMYLVDAIYVLDDVDSRIVYVKDFIREVTGLDCSLYLSQILSLDMLLLNDDRHFNNLGVVINNESGACRPAPIFDLCDAGRKTGK